MRPLRLKLQGFSAFREATEISFEGTDLLAFVGPTGSGKSSLIDAMTFALYGSVSRYDDLRLVEPVIHQLATEARVQLDFEVGGRHYTAVRVVRRTATGATTKEARLVRTGPDGDEILAGQKSEMDGAVLGLLGLDFAQFTRTVVLPQGDFARFLHATKGDRQDLLRQLLDIDVYKRMGSRARSRSEAGRAQLKLFVDQRDSAPEVTQAQLAELEARITTLDELGATVKDRLAEMAGHQRELAEATDRAESLDRLARSLAAVEMPEAVTSLAAQLAAADTALLATTTGLEAARLDRDAAETAAREAPAAAELGLALRDVEELAGIRAEIEILAPEVSSAGDLAVEADRVEQAARAACDEAGSALDAAKDSAGLGAAIAALVLGEPCPVCAQTVLALPGHDVDAELQRSRAKFEELKERATDAAAAAKTLSRAQHEVAAKLAALETRESTLDAKVRDAIPAAAPSAPQLDPSEPDDPGASRLEVYAQVLRSRIEEADALAVAVEAAAKALTEAERRQQQAQRDRDALGKAEQELRGHLAQARDNVAARQPPPPAGDSLEGDWADLVAWSQQEAGQVEVELTAANAAVELASAAMTSISNELGAACAAAGIDPPLSDAPASIASALAYARAALASALAQIEARAELDRTISELDAAVAVDVEMGRLLSANGFERWLLQSALDDLLSRATERLSELSAGQFSLESTDGDFSIRDHRNADERRSVRTLSGGETFLASLALALALAESVADLAVEGAPRIESMFLDEGFGTLDPDTLDVVATTMEELSASGRLIGIVTHIRELADRMPVRFEVHKDATTARVERVEV